MPWPYNTSSRAASARLYARRRKRGVCVLCETPSGDAVHCTECAAAHGEKHRETYALKRANGICARCKDDAMPGKALCLRHARAERDRQRERNRRAALAAGRVYRPRYRKDAA